MADLVLASSSVEWNLIAAGAQAGLAVLKNRRKVAEVWKAIRASLRGRTYRIAVTGAEGSGKSVLMDRLEGRGYEPGYQPPGRHRGLDKEEIRYAQTTLELLAIPGQEVQTQRYDVLDKVFLDRNKTVSGVIHVVANGFLDPSRLPNHDVAIAEGLDTIDSYRTISHEREIQEWAQTANMIRQHWVRHRKPMWLLVVVDKVDLYRAEVASARERYESSPASPFVQGLEELQRAVGWLNLRIQVVPACSHLVAFRWNGEEVRPAALPAERDALLAQVLAHIEEFCRAQ